MLTMDLQYFAYGPSNTAYPVYALFTQVWFDKVALQVVILTNS